VLGAAIDDFYLTNPIARASAVMAECSLIAEAAARCRARPGALAMTTGNGWFLTKQSCGIWSTTPVQCAWTRQDPKVLQAEIDALHEAMHNVNVDEGQTMTVLPYANRLPPPRHENRSRP